MDRRCASLPLGLVTVQLCVAPFVTPFCQPLIDRSFPHGGVCRVVAHGMRLEHADGGWYEDIPTPHIHLLRPSASLLRPSLFASEENVGASWVQGIDSFHGPLSFPTFRKEFIGKIKNLFLQDAGSA